MKIFQDIAESIGRTPLVQINKISGCSCARVLAKIEGRNPAYSVKCRIGASMIWDAEEKGLIRPGTEIIEPTSGNTGIALAYVCAARGYQLTLTMPDDMSIERRRMLATFGARLELTPAAAERHSHFSSENSIFIAKCYRYTIRSQTNARYPHQESSRQSASPP